MSKYRKRIKQKFKGIITNIIIFKKIQLKNIFASFNIKYINIFNNKFLMENFDLKINKYATHINLQIYMWTQELLIYCHPKL